jgi:hypothetical protein
MLVQGRAQAPDRRGLREAGRDRNHHRARLPARGRAGRPRGPHRQDGPGGPGRPPGGAAGACLLEVQGPAAWRRGVARGGPRAKWKPCRLAGVRIIAQDRWEEVRPSSRAVGSPRSADPCLIRPPPARHQSAFIQTSVVTLLIFNPSRWFVVESGSRPRPREELAVALALFSPRAGAAAQRGGLSR